MQCRNITWVEYDIIMALSLGTANKMSP